MMDASLEEDSQTSSILRVYYEPPTSSTSEVRLLLFHCNVVEGHCFQAMKIMHHHANGCFDWLISEHQSADPWREAVSILYGKT